MHNVGNAQTLCRCLKAHICMSDHLISDHLKIAYITCPGPCKCTFERCNLCNKGHMMPKKYPNINLQWKPIFLQTLIFQCEYWPTLKLLLAGPAKEKYDIEQDEYKDCFKTVDESCKFLSKSRILFRGIYIPHYGKTTLKITTRISASQKSVLAGLCPINCNSFNVKGWKTKPNRHNICWEKNI